MTRMRRLPGKSRRKRSDTPVVLNLGPSNDDEYEVGPGRPPKAFQFKPGQSGNPKGAKRKAPSITPDLKALLEHALGKKVKLTQGEKERIVTKAEAGMEQLVNQFAKGDRYARRDLIVLAGTLGVDLVAGQGKEIEKALEAAVTANDEALVADFLQRHGVRRDHRGDDSRGSSSRSPGPGNARERCPPKATGCRPGAGGRSIGGPPRETCGRGSGPRFCRFGYRLGTSDPWRQEHPHGRGRSRG